MSTFEAERVLFLSGFSASGFSRLFSAVVADIGSFGWSGGVRFEVNTSTFRGRLGAEREIKGEELVATDLALSVLPRALILLALGCWQAVTLLHTTTDYLHCMSEPIPPAATAIDHERGSQSTPPPYVPPGENIMRETDPEIPEPFKYSDIVAECEVDIRHRFLQRVYFLLSTQLAITVGLSILLISHPTWQAWALNNQWTMILTGIGSFGFMLGAMILRRKYPWNLVFLSLFTLCESWLVGVVTSLSDSHAVLNAFIITAVVFVGLSAFALQTTYDFTSWMPYLCMFLFAMIGLGFVTMFTHSTALDLAYSFIGVVLFSVFILVDTQMIMNKFYPEDEVPATIQLYLDIINLFLYILRILSSNSDS